MRDSLCQSLLRHAADSDFVFLTGDLGFRALEPLRAAAGPRFINAGVAEQNMVSTAAGLARTGLKPWVYSIAPFVYARPYEQIRNDVCMHDLPVTLIGNGGGYAYGAMGETHHALGDYGALLCFPEMRAFVPAFAADVAALVDQLSRFQHPAYLRLGWDELPRDTIVPPYAPWRRLAAGGGPTLVAAGTLTGGLWTAVGRLPEDRRPNLWTVAELPLRAEAIPPEFLADLRQSRRLIVAEEHVAQGGVGQMLLYSLAELGRSPPQFTHRSARGYSSGFGSQAFHRKECGLDAESIVAEALG
jgi:transketolase